MFPISAAILLKHVLPQGNFWHTSNTESHLMVKMMVGHTTEQLGIIETKLYG